MFCCELPFVRAICLTGVPGSTQSSFCFSPTITHSCAEMQAPHGHQANGPPGASQSVKRMHQLVIFAGQGAATGAPSRRMLRAKARNSGKCQLAFFCHVRLGRHHLPSVVEVQV